MSADTRAAAIAAFESMRAKIQECYKDRPEPTQDEINAFIAAVRRERKERCERLASKHETAGT